jgi:hypothetical protein
MKRARRRGAGFPDQKLPRSQGQLFRNLPQVKLDRSPPAARTLVLRTRNVLSLRHHRCERRGYPQIRHVPSDASPRMLPTPAKSTSEENVRGLPRGPSGSRRLGAQRDRKLGEAVRAAGRKPAPSARAKLLLHSLRSNRRQEIRRTIARWLISSSGPPQPGAE